jgi:hypothetical protein
MSNGPVGPVGPVGPPVPPQTRAPKAWNHMLLGLLQELPRGLERSRQARRRMLRAKR